MIDSHPQSSLLSPDAADLFVSVAAASSAEEISAIDVPHGHAEARRALEAAIESAERRRPSCGTRLALVVGASGTGKTHVLAATLRAAAFDGSRHIYPAVLQLSAPVAVEDYEWWLVDAVFRELLARHFPGPEGRSPLRRIADQLLDRLSAADRDEYRQYIDDADDGEVILAKDLGERIRQQGLLVLRDHPPSVGFLAALLLAGYGEDSAVTYLRRGQLDDRMKLLGLVRPKSGRDRLDLIINRGLAAELAGGTIVLAYDQVENVVQLGSRSLFVHGLRQAVRLTEQVRSVAVALVVLESAYDVIARGDAGLAESDVDRIENVPPEVVRLLSPSRELIDEVVRRRLVLLEERRGDAPPAEPLQLLPTEVLESERRQDSLRRALNEVSRYRQKALRPEPEQGGDIDEPIHLDLASFDKLWVDHLDAGPKSEIRMTTPTKAELLRWWAHAAGSEKQAPYGVSANLTELSTPKTLVIDVEVLDQGTPIPGANWRSAKRRTSRGASASRWRRFWKPARPYPSSIEIRVLREVHRHR